MADDDVIYDLWFVREYEDREDTELRIGLYRTEADAKAAIEARIGQPGFRDFPEGFVIYPERLNRGGWEKGFVNVFHEADSRDRKMDHYEPRPPRTHGKISEVG